MKAINASVVPGTAETYMLENCRHLRGFRSSEVKRESRRKQRHALRAELESVVEQGMAEGCLFTNLPALKGMSRLPVNTKGEPLFLVPAETSEQQRFTNVTVIRKRAGQRTIVEQLRVLA